MSRVKITEYRAKKLIAGDEYEGVLVREGERPRLPKRGRFVIKVDQGVKKRFKQGLVAVDIFPREVPRTIAQWRKKGFTQFLLEPFVPHRSAEEQYLSLERVREGIRIMHAKQGGVDIEAHPEAVKTFIASAESDVPHIAKHTKLPEPFLRHVLDVFEKNFFAFLELNPLVVRRGSAHPLDAAALVDSAGAFFVRGAWGEGDIVRMKAKHPSEERVFQLAQTTPASLRLTVLNPNGALFFLLSGGGGSIVIADEAALRGAGSLIGNYGEYSGDPTREETYLYAREVLRLLLGSRAKKKALVIAGGVANFTDISETFTGVIEALSEVADKLRKAGVRVFVRRGGPNEVAGLARMREFLKREKLFGSVYGSDEVITKAVDDAIRFIQK